MSKGVIKTIVIILSLAANFFFIFLFITKNNLSKDKQPDNFPLLSKRIFVTNQNDIIINFIPLRNAIREYADSLNGKLGVYFEYLPSGVSIGAYDRDEVRLASLSKVPLVMSIYKKVERRKLAEDKVLVIKEGHIDQRFGNLWKRGEGTPLTVNELIEYVLTESDNTAYNVLYDELSREEIAEVYENLDISLGEDGGSPIISPKNYSSIFRSLYLSSFLSEEKSNLILQILTQTKFSDKMVAGVPNSVKVSHKIGVFERQNEESLFTDCGIIFATDRPYILCAFVKGNEADAREYISHVSRMIYQYVVRVKGD